jgi:hypothetical protein
MSEKQQVIGSLNEDEVQQIHLDAFDASGSSGT